MPGKLLGRWRTIAAASALITASAGVAIVVATPATAAGTGTAVCCCNHESGHSYNPSPPPANISTWNLTACPTHVTYYPVEIFKLVNGSWKEVAFGSGGAEYVCNGSAATEYRAPDFTSTPFQEPCG